MFVRVYISVWHICTCIIYTNMNTHIYECTHIYQYTRTAYMPTRMYIFTRRHIHQRSFACIFLPKHYLLTMFTHMCVYLCMYVCMHMNAYQYASICQWRIHSGSFTGAPWRAVHLPRHRNARLISFACGGGWAGGQWAAVYDLWGHSSQVWRNRKFDVVQGDRHCEMCMMQCNCVQKWKYIWCSAIVCISLWCLTLSDSLYYSAPMLSYRHISPAPLFRLTSSFLSPSSFHPLPMALCWWHE